MTDRSLEATVGQAFAARAAEHPERPAFLSLEGCLTYGELEAQSRAVADALVASGLAPSRSTGIMLAGPDCVVAYLGASRAGNRVVPIEPRFRGEQLRHILLHSDVDAILVDGESAGRVHALPGLPPVAMLEVSRLLSSGPVPAARLPGQDPEAEHAVVFSSGSTGLPKGVIITNQAMRARVELTSQVYGPGRRHLVMTPMTLAYGFVDGMIVPLVYGGQTVYLGQYLPARYRQVWERYRPEIVLGLPFFYEHLGPLAAPLARDSGCVFFSAGEPLAAPVRAAFESAAEMRIHQVYGASEISVIAADLHDQEPRPGKSGRLLPGVEVRTVDASGDGAPTDVPAGELWVKRSPRSMKGYVPGTEGGGSRWIGDYFALGDVCSIDAEGFVEVLGRVDDFVHAGGARFHPTEIENVLLSVPGVREAAFVCHGPAGSSERRSCAYVVLDPERPAAMESIRVALRDQLPPSRWPDEIKHAVRLPRTPNGKLHRAMLTREELEPG